MKYLLVLLLLLATACDNGKVIFCGVDGEKLAWTCTRVYRATDNPAESITNDKHMISCTKYGSLPWVCESTSGGLSIIDPTKYSSDHYIVIIAPKK